MAKTFFVSPGRSYTVTASAGSSIAYPNNPNPIATIGDAGSVTFNSTGTEIVVSDNNAKIVQNFSTAGAAAVGAGGGSVSSDDYALLEGNNTFTGTQDITGDVTITGTLIVTDGVNGTSVVSDDTPEGIVNLTTYTTTDGTTTLYLAAEGSPAAIEKYNGAAFLGFTVTSPEGTILSQGTKALIDLLNENTTNN